jgi:hypothetical protein
LAEHAQREQLTGQWVTGATRRELLPGLAMDDGTVEWGKALSPGEVRMIMAARRPFWGVTREGRLDLLLDRDKLALIWHASLPGNPLSGDEGAVRWKSCTVVSP